MSERAIQRGRFDREFSLAELLRGIDHERLANALAKLIGPGVRLSDRFGKVLFERPGTLAGSVTIATDLEPLGQLEGSREAQLTAAVELLRQVLRVNTQYLMASELHIETVHNDYEELQSQNAALQQSEARYKALAEQLEQRVAEQVKTIEAAQRQLYQNEKLAAVGQLAAGVAHEINNPLGFISSNLSTARDYLGRLRTAIGELSDSVGEEVAHAISIRHDLDFILEDFEHLMQESSDGASRVARIVADLKGFSRIDQVGDEQADINSLIRQVCNVAEGQIKTRLTFRFHFDKLPPLRCDAGQIGQLLLNLLLNAADAVTPPGEVIFETAHVGDEITIRISDNGNGITPELLPRIFDPFFTTKGVGRGTGLGLTMSNDIVRAHGGRIEVDSTPGEGTTFTIRLPLVGTARREVAQ